MYGFHVTFNAFLVPILNGGIEPRITTDHHYPMAHGNKTQPYVFFWKDRDSAFQWYRIHHRFCEAPVAIRRAGSCIVMFEVPNEELVERDPYSYFENNYMRNALRYRGYIHPRYIFNYEYMEGGEQV